MLIRSPRHRAEDLELWSRLETMDRLNYQLRKVQAKAVRSLESIQRFTLDSPTGCYAAVSWGKDSTVLAHLVAIENERRHLQGLREGKPAAPPIPLAWVTVGTLDVGCRQVRDHFLSLFPCPYHEVQVDPGERTEHGTTGKRDGFRCLESTLGPRRLIGIRADESYGRRVSGWTWGIESPSSCRPLLWWTAEDVFAYLAFHGLPVHPNYAMLGGGRWERNQLRTAPLGGRRGEQYGRPLWEREYYGDVLREETTHG